jgi:hypothetical protein
VKRFHVPERQRLQSHHYKNLKIKDYKLMKKHPVLQPYNCGNKVNHIFSENAVQLETQRTSHPQQ